MRNGPIFAVVLTVILSSCASTGGGPRAISYQEATAFERASPSRPLPEPPAPTLFVQPENKTEACRLPTTQDQLDRENLRVYWDGQCKDGFAFGLGRDIALSDTHHVEEITYHDGTGFDWARPAVFYDFVNEYVVYRVGGKSFPEEVLIKESFSRTYEGLEVEQEIVSTNPDGDGAGLGSSPLRTESTFLWTDWSEGITYGFTDYSAGPTAPGSPRLSMRIMDDDGNLTGVTMDWFSNGAMVSHLAEDGLLGEIVRPPAEFVREARSKYVKARLAVNRAITRLEAAQQMEREYLYKACGEHGGVPGLSAETYKAICTWRDQFQEPFAEASARFQKELDALRRQARSDEERRLLEERIALQQQILRQQQAWSQASQAAAQLQRMSGQTLRDTVDLQAPQVQPFASPERRGVVCHKIGTIVSCY